MRVLQVDITTLAVDAIVNAANVSLLGGGGVDRAIHEAAGPGLLEECRRLGGCAVGDAKATAGHGLPARWVFHAVGPIWEGGEAGEAELLAGCHRRCIELANERSVASIAFPAISCGAFGYPADRAAAVAVAAVRAALDRGSTVEDVVFAVFGSATETAYRAAVAAR